MMSNQRSQLIALNSNSRIRVATFVIIAHIETLKWKISDGVFKVFKDFKGF